MQLALTLKNARHRHKILVYVVLFLGSTGLTIWPL